MYMPSWHQPCGDPLLSVSINARMRVPTKRMANIGQNITTPLQFSIVWLIKAHSKPVNSLIVIAAQIQIYTKKNWNVRLMTHCMVGEIGIVYSGPFGCSIVKMECRSLSSRFAEGKIVGHSRPSVFFVA